MKYALCYRGAIQFMFLWYKNLVKSILMEVDVRQISKALCSSKEGKSYLGEKKILISVTIVL